MKKLFLVLTLVLFTILLPSQNIFGLALTNLLGNPNDQQNNEGSAYADLTFTSSTITQTELAIYIPEQIASGTNLAVRLYNDSTLVSTLYPSFYLWEYIDITDYTSTTINKIMIIYYSDLVHMYDSPDINYLYDTKLVEDTEFVESIYFTVSQDDNDYAKGYGNGYSLGFTNGKGLYEDLFYECLVLEDTDNNGLEDCSYDEGFSEGYYVSEIENGGGLQWIETFFSLFDTIFSIELLPNITIGVILGVIIIPPIVIGVIKWLT